MTTSSFVTLKHECYALIDQGNTLMGSAPNTIDHDMATFIRTYLVALRRDVNAAAQTTEQTHGVVLQIVLEEIRDLVREIERRVEPNRAADSVIRA